MEEGDPVMFSLEKRQQRVQNSCGFGDKFVLMLDQEYTARGSGKEEGKCLDLKFGRRLRAENIGFEPREERWYLKI